jgi:glyceraldehyde 3-phosphate dehydrogenase
MQKIRIGINGFGRIGRSLARVVADNEYLEIVAINDLADVNNLAHLLKYDSTHGRFPLSVQVDGGDLLVDGKRICVFHQKEPAYINWFEAEVDIVIEATGKFKTSDLLQGHIDIGKAKKVILSVPPLDDIKTIIMGINEELISKNDTILSNASCTTNSAAPLIKVMDELCGIEHAYITTVHSYTTDQQLQDGPHKDYRRGRAAAESIVPTTTGAAKAITKVFPELQGRIGGAGIRVPVPNGSLTDITFTVERSTTVEEVNQAFKKAAEKGKLHSYLGYTSDPIVSKDIIGSPYSCLFDEGLTSVLGKMVKVVGWYDNEMGYSHRLADLIQKVMI